MPKFSILTGLWFLVLGALATADDALYSAAPPAGSAFVRVVSIAEAAPGDLVLNGVSVPVATTDGAVPYQIIPGGVAEIEAGPASATAQFDAQKSYTVVISNSSVAVIDDTMEPNLTKSTVVFYNLTDEDSVGLSTADGKTPVFSAIGAFSSKTIAVNPIAIAFGVTNEGTVAAVAEEIQLERGKVYSVFSSKSQEKYQIKVTKNSIAN